VALEGDWVAGFGGATPQVGGSLVGHLIYAMRVDEVLTMPDYDRFALQRWPHRIPKPASLDLADRLGDCIYDHSRPGVPKRRAGSVHQTQADQDRDLGGHNVLISYHFYYFGSRAIPLPPTLARSIVHQGQGHRSRFPQQTVDDFVQWIDGGTWKPGQIHGWPNYIIDWANVPTHTGCAAGNQVTDDQSDSGFEPDEGDITSTC
jgi:hypothetical protein